MEKENQQETTGSEDKPSLPFLQEGLAQQLPKDYNKTIERLSAQLEQNNPNNVEGKTLFATALVISFILMFVQIMELLAYPKWMEWVHPFLIFVEAAIPFVVSFFLKQPKYATLLRLIGIIVLVVYLFTLF